MARTKLEVVFIRYTDSEEIAHLGDFNFISDGPVIAPTIHIPTIGERVVVDLPGKNFGGKVIEKWTVYDQKDVMGQEWDWVTRIILAVELNQPGSSLPFLVK